MISASSSPISVAEKPDAFEPIDVPEGASKLDMVKAAGIVGMGGAGFPTGVKLGIDLSATERRQLQCRKVHAQALSYYRALLAHRIDIRKKVHCDVRLKLNGGNKAHVFMDVPVGVSVGELIEKAGGIDGTYRLS